MFTETVDKTHACNKGTRGHHLLPLFIALVPRNNDLSDQSARADHWRP
jgi:hypothetical protein